MPVALSWIAKKANFLICRKRRFLFQDTVLRARAIRLFRADIFYRKKNALESCGQFPKAFYRFFILASVLAEYYDDFLRNFPTAKAAAAIANIAAAAFGSGTAAFITPTPLKSKPGDPCVG